MGNQHFEQIMGIFDNRTNFELLAEDFRNGRILPFIGAGFSRPQFPDWIGLIERKSREYGVGDEVKTEMESGNMEKAASVLMDAMGTRGFKDYFTQTFQKETDSYPICIYARFIIHIIHLTVLQICWRNCRDILLLKTAA